MSLEILRQAIDQYGQQKALAYDVGLSPSLVSDAYRGQRPASPKILKALGLERTIEVTRTVEYKRKEDEK